MLGAVHDEHAANAAFVSADPAASLAQVSGPHLFVPASATSELVDEQAATKASAPNDDRARRRP